MNACILAYLDDGESAYRFGLGLDTPPPHIIDELRARWWFWRRHGFRLPVRRAAILLKDNQT